MLSPFLQGAFILLQTFLICSLENQCLPQLTATLYSQFLFTTLLWIMHLNWFAILKSHSLVTENVQHDWTVTMVTHTSEPAWSCQQVPKTLSSYMRVFLVIPVSDALSTTPRALTSSRVLSRAVALKTRVLGNRPEAKTRKFIYLPQQSSTASKLLVTFSSVFHNMSSR